MITKLVAMLLLGTLLAGCNQPLDDCSFQPSAGSVFRYQLHGIAQSMTVQPAVDSWLNDGPIGPPPLYVIEGTLEVHLASEPDDDGHSFVEEIWAQNGDGLAFLGDTHVDQTGRFVTANVDHVYKRRGSDWANTGDRLLPLAWGAQFAWGPGVETGTQFQNVIPVDVYPDEPIPTTIDVTIQRGSGCKAIVLIDIPAGRLRREPQQVEIHLEARHGYPESVVWTRGNLVVLTLDLLDANTPPGDAFPGYPGSAQPTSYQGVERQRLGAPAGQLSTLSFPFSEALDAAELDPTVQVWFEVYGPAALSGLLYGTPDNGAAWAFEWTNDAGTATLSVDVSRNAGVPLVESTIGSRTGGPPDLPILHADLDAMFLAATDILGQAPSSIACLDFSWDMCVFGPDEADEWLEDDPGFDLDEVPSYGVRFQGETGFPMQNKKK